MNPAWLFRGSKKLHSARGNANRRTRDKSRRFARRLVSEPLECRALLAAGMLDPMFGVEGKVTTDFPDSRTDYGNALVIAHQTDGKIVVAGQSSGDFALARYNADGSLDMDFGNGGKVTTDFDSREDRAYGVVVQPDGKILLGGHAVRGVSTDFALARYNPDGNLDTSFGSGGKVTTDFGTFDDRAYGVALQSDGKVVLAGYLNYDTGGRDYALARYNADGSLDSGFGLGGKVIVNSGSSNDEAYAVAIQSDGKIVLAGHSYWSGSGFNFTLVRLNSNGSLHGGTIVDFGSKDDQAYGLAIDADGKIVMAGFSEQVATGRDFAVARFNSDLTLDTSFGVGGGVTTDFGSANDVGYNVAIDADGKIVTAGFSIQSYGYDFALARYNANGTLDGSFDGDGKVTTDIGSASDYAVAVAIQADGRIVVGGYTYQAGHLNDFAIARYMASGSLDTTFGTGGIVATDFRGPTINYGRGAVVASQPDGRILVAGTAYLFGSGSDFALARYNMDGSLDASFGSGGKATASFGFGDYAYGIALQADGKILVAGYAAVTGGDFGLARFNGDGSLDPSFGNEGKVTTDFDLSFDQAHAVAVDAAGKIVLAGSSSSAGGTGTDFALVRYNADGTLDTAFGDSGKVTTDFGLSSDLAHAVAVQLDGKLIVAGYTRQSGGDGLDLALARYNVDGSLDANFGDRGRVTTDLGSRYDEAYGVVVQPDGRIVVVSYFYQLATRSDFALLRYNGDGSLDTSFGSGGTVLTDFGSSWDAAYTVALESDGKIVAAGITGQGGSTGWDFALARYSTDGSLDMGFGTGGKVITDFGSGDDQAYGIAVQPDGQIVAAGYSYQAASGYDFALARYLVNSPPLADAGGPYTVIEGETVSLDATGTTDPDQPFTSLNYTWDLDGDGVFGETGLAAAHGDETGIQPTFIAGELNAPASITVGLRVTDNRGQTSSDTANITITSRPPIADAGGPYLVDEGGTIPLNASGTTDRDQSPDTLVYAWDLDRDGSFGETGAAAANGDEIGISPVFVVRSLDGPASVTVKLQVTDSDGNVSSDTATINITNIAPTVVVSGPASGVPGQIRSFVLSASDPSFLDQMRWFKYTIDWDGDGIVDETHTVRGTFNSAVGHVYPTTGSYTIRATATDMDGGTSTIATHAIQIKAAELQDDDVSGGSMLVVGGTTDDDRIVFTPGASAGQIQVTLNGVSQGEFMPTGRLVALGQAGNDDIQVAGSITLPAWFYGGPGDDRLKGGAGHDVILGDEGDDLLVGSDGRDLLVGGYGADRLVGNADDDILIAGYTIYDGSPYALRTVTGTWTRLDVSYEERITKLGIYWPLAGFDVPAVYSDGDIDVLTGSAGLDWFFFDPDRDRATDLKDEVFANDLAWILA